MRPLLLVTLVTISPAPPAKTEVLLTFTIANLNFDPKKMTVFSCFELLVMKSMQPTQSLFIATSFLTEFHEFLSDLVDMADNIHIFGDFNIHMEKSIDPLQKPSSTQWVLSNMTPDLLTATVILWT
ncbi:unnamed protein product [Oncorhynchus mykiss]|uniref:Endonuclease/exonuclease/phosphatase domain-containing protein n=1 Tax=Oncorhynchus mykiss TaxID=8022 RepID=A0A060YLX8_ONCMY|nr:unnamed protein product [Oncorhynchus mykiss]